MAPRKPAKGVRTAKARAPGARDHRLPDKLPAGLQLVDLRQSSWQLGESIGVGGFGEIYLATAKPSSASSGEPQHVVKIEPHTNGPLFCEVHCYMRLCAAGAVQAWMQEKRLTRLGMPEFAGNGSVEYAGNKYRFMVMERFGTDLQRLLQSNGGVFPIVTVLRVAIQVIDTLEYIHSKGYVHADIKAQNLLLGWRKGLGNQVYLVDFGLACRYLSATDGVHIPYAPDARKAHNGTIEFTSRDAHVGANSRRGDLEILGYNLLQWAAGGEKGALPWMHELAAPDRVAALKCRYMQDSGQLVAACFSQTQCEGIGQEIEAIAGYLRCVADLEFEQKPDYDRLRSLLRAPLTARGLTVKHLLSTPLLFTGTNESALVSKASPAPTARGKTAAVRRGAATAKKRRCGASPACFLDRQSPGQENTANRATVAPPTAGRRTNGRRPLASVTDNASTSLPPPPIDLDEAKVPHLPLRSDGRLCDFDFANYDRALNDLRRSSSGRSSAATTPSKDSASQSPPSGLATFSAESAEGLAGLGRLNAAMKEVLAKSMASRAARARKAALSSSRHSTQKRPRAKKRASPKSSPAEASDECCAPPTQAMLDVMSRINMRRRLSTGRQKRLSTSITSGRRSINSPVTHTPAREHSLLSTDDDSFHTPPTNQPPRRGPLPQRRHRSGVVYDTP